LVNLFNRHNELERDAERLLQDGRKHGMGGNC
jgi:hypothetical protein